jgi:hypothetical protein
MLELYLRRSAILAFGWAAVLVATPAFAACRIELAVYGDLEQAAELDFSPARDSATVTNNFRMTLDNDTVLDGIVQWSEDGVRRPRGSLMYKCPEGDVTGDELAACTVWEGVIYTADEQGNIELLPPEGVEAPKKLILPALGPSLRFSSAYGAKGFSKVPWDVFELRDCQE